MGRLSALPNIAGALEQQLRAAGIETPEQLAEIGSRAAWQRIRAVDPSACYARLCALEGAILGVRWHNLPPERKAELKEFYQSAKNEKEESCR